MKAMLRVVPSGRVTVTVAPAPARVICAAQRPVGMPSRVEQGIIAEVAGAVVAVASAAGRAGAAGSRPAGRGAGRVTALSCAVAGPASGSAASKTATREGAKRMRADGCGMACSFLM